MRVRGHGGEGCKSSVQCWEVSKQSVQGNRVRSMCKIEERESVRGMGA